MSVELSLSHLKNDVRVLRVVKDSRVTMSIDTLVEEVNNQTDLGCLTHLRRRQTLCPQACLRSCCVGGGGWWEEGWRRRNKRSVRILMLG